MSPRKNNRPPAPSKDQLRAVSDELTRFVHSNLRDPERALADMASIKNDAAPEPEHVSHEDLIRQPGERGLRSQFDQGPGVTEVHGPDYERPLQRYSHPAAAGGHPAPSVSTADPADFPYHAAGSGALIAPARRPLGYGAHQGLPIDLPRGARPGGTGPVPDKASK